MKQKQTVQKADGQFFVHFRNVSYRKHPIAFSFILLSLLFLASCSKKEEVPTSSYAASTVSSMASTHNIGIGREILYHATQLVFAPIQQEMGLN